MTNPYREPSTQAEQTVEVETHDILFTVYYRNADDEIKSIDYLIESQPKVSIKYERDKTTWEGGCWTDCGIESTQSLLDKIASKKFFLIKDKIVVVDRIIDITFKIQKFTKRVIPTIKWV